MEIEQSSLYREVLQIQNNGENPVHNAWSAQIFIGTDETPIIPLKLMSIDFNHDFQENYAEDIHVTVLVGKGTYARRIYPALDQLDVSLICQPINEVSDSLNVALTPTVERYTATMIDTGNPIIEMDTRNSPSEEILNLTGLIEVTFQLVNKSLEQIRMISINGIVYRSVTGEDVIKALLTKGSQNVDVDASRKVKGVDMIKASNQVKREQIIIPHGTKLVDLPHYIHFKCGGVYNAGLGYYLQNDHWYVYPSYDTTRFNDTDKTLTVINIPPNRMPGTERTYRKDGSNLVILSTGSVKFRDHSNTAQLNQGNGVRFADADRLMDKFVATSGNKAIASRGGANSEFISDKRVNGQNNVTVGVRPINANPYVEFSALSKRQGSLVTLVWESADRTLLYPGMPVKVMYLDGEDIKFLYGNLLKAHTYISLREAGPASSRMVANTMLGVFIKPVEDTTTTVTAT